MSASIKNLEPKILWEEFYEITRIPRPSKHEEKIIAYLLEFGKKHGIETHRDKAGNVLMRKPATKGYENRKSILLQSHMDMVCEKNSDVEHDFMKDPINAYIDGDWVRARGTTLGGDDGIGMAAQLAVLIDPTVEHGPIECLFTVDEETGLTGAFELEAGFFNSKIVLNLDSEDEGELFIGCAGGVDTIALFPYATEPAPQGVKAFSIEVSGLKGGHSGDDIHKGLGNAVKLLSRILFHLREVEGFAIGTLEAGNLRNAIAREGKAVIAVPASREKQIATRFEEMAKALRFEYRTTEPDLRIACESAATPQTVIRHEDSEQLLRLLMALPHGAQEMSREMEGLVETSTNLASIKPDKPLAKADARGRTEQFLITTSQRSSVDSAKDCIAASVESVFELAGCEWRHTDGYPGWAPNPQSEILEIAETAYKKLFGNEPIVRAIHAGLECGLFLQKYPGLDMLSFGPTIRGAHSPDERLDIPSTKKFWDLLLEILRKAPKEA